MASIPELAVRAQDLGYSSIWAPEVNGVEAFTMLGAISGLAPNLSLGTGVIPIQLRPPTLVAMAAATLQALRPEREVLIGIGISSPVVTEMWHSVPFGERHLARIREYVAVLRACLAGERVDFCGDFYNVSRFRLSLEIVSARPRIIIAALNPQMLHLAGEIGDGVLLNYLPASHVPWSVEQVRAGGPARVYAYLHVGVGESVQGEQAARRDLLRYVMVDAYADHFVRAGFSHEIRDVRERFAAGDRAGAATALTDAFVREVVPTGTAERVTEALQTYVDAGVEYPIVFPLTIGDPLASANTTLAAAAAAHLHE